MTRVVFDTNVIVSALLFHDCVPGRAFARALDHGTILVSTALARELGNILRRDKFDRYISRKERDGFLVSFVQEAVMTEITESIRICRDAKDNQILELAINGNAEFIVTGDTDLLVLSPFRSMRILTPAEFHKLPM